MPHTLLNDITNFLMPEFQWQKDNETDCSLRFFLSNSAETLSKTQMRNMAHKYGIEALELMKLRSLDTGKRYNQPFATLGNGESWTTTSGGNLGTQNDVRNILKFIDDTPLEELRKSSLVQALYNAFIAGDKKCFETQVFPKLESIFSQFAREHKISYNEANVEFTIELKGIDIQKASLLTSSACTSFVTHLSTQLAPQNISLQIKDQFTLEFSFGAQHYSDAKAGILAGFDLKRVMGNHQSAPIDDHYQDIYKDNITAINERIAQEYQQNILNGMEQSRAMDLAPKQHVRTEQARGIAEKHPKRFSMLVPITIENIQYFEAIKAKQPEAMYKIIAKNNATKNQNANALAIPAEGRNISIRQAMTLCQNIMIKVKATIKDIPATLTKDLNQLLLKHVKSSNVDGTIPKEMEAKLIETVSLALLKDPKQSSESLAKVIQDAQVQLVADDVYQLQFSA